MPTNPDLDAAQQGDNSSPGLDLVTLYSSHGMEGEVEVDIIQGILEASGIPSIVSGTPYPPLGFDVKVARDQLQTAQQLLDEAQAGGAEAADAAEAASEESK